MKENTKKWVSFAEEDLKMAELAFDEKIFNQTCFHAQQCIEKLLKSLIIQSGKIQPRSHKIADLLMLTEDTFSEPVKKELLLLDRFYIPTRYPDTLPGILANGLPSETDAKQALETARKCYEIVMKNLK